MKRLLLIAIVLCVVKQVVLKCPCPKRKQVDVSVDDVLVKGRLPVRFVSCVADTSDEGSLNYMKLCVEKVYADKYFKNKNKAKRDEAARKIIRDYLSYEDREDIDLFAFRNQADSHDLHFIRESNV